MRVNGCKTCKHYNVNTCKCRAFPNGIPEDIKFGKTFHSIEIEGDNGYRYEPDENGFYLIWGVRRHDRKLLQVNTQ